jgi:hypothetical protein
VGLIPFSLEEVNHEYFPKLFKDFKDAMCLLNSEVAVLLEESAKADGSEIESGYFINIVKKN